VESVKAKTALVKRCISGAMTGMGKMLEPVFVLEVCEERDRR